MLKKQHAINERKIYVRENYLQVPWVHMSKDFFRISNNDSNNYETDNILGSIILEESLDAL